ncbi:LytR/AlgR family response regulator transcription factor [Marinilabilia rubra]|uniref:DNA-binding response regulator n=1 Tax=Marinilabilia rubra TaxID=2162893 RepID=A0A2U2B8C8_9BACT|nr:LytTR family DNA-binding domain-containing protein [Marinilabilia rubra]PWD99319.1 DNA-binding response regulator [Marinilabilia rubra]
MKAVIIDDEPNARSTLRGMLNMLFQDLEIVGEADGVASGKTIIETHRPEIVFLDIRMKDGTGFDMLRQLKTRDFALVFLTAHDDHAIEAFRFSATDYLLKPVDPDDLKDAVEKVRRHNTNNQALLGTLMENIQQASAPSKKLALKSSEAIHIVCTDDIIRCESMDNYTRFILKDQKPLVISRPLKAFDEMLEGVGFLRIHQSHLINLSHIRKIDRKGGFIVELSDGSEAPVSVRKKEKLLKRLQTI